MKSKVLYSNLQLVMQHQKAINEESVAEFFEAMSSVLKRLDAKTLSAEFVAFTKNQLCDVRIAYMRKEQPRKLRINWPNPEHGRHRFSINVVEGRDLGWDRFHVNEYLTNLDDGTQLRISTKMVEASDSATFEMYRKVFPILHKWALDYFNK